MFQRNDNVKLAVLEEKLSTTSEVISKLDENIEQLSHLSVNVSKMLAVHEEKIEVSREAHLETEKEIGELSDRLEEKYKCLAKRLTALEFRVWMAAGAFAIIGICLQIGIIEGVTLSQKSVIMEVSQTE
ncbi:hypothetical protein Syn7803US13_188 [Synechococcus phage ACG-2014f]|uniref:DUF7201 domain-containing protein n=3 Tax=Atlauavirus TaxID=2733092 RepID=A0A0E3FPP2_9CAUD|nr:hypothetical protein HOQ62_gp198 [Synechococcus phage ACG-2014f_Syn7803C8]YP_009778915.1 hypothetical protein HOQ63_gp188 [Synechococcus phage ACG-2014f_Syn7803US26]AIX27548.1 hypothetical protein Syn7803US13_188 [Synechococcus phage ACG-2014f]AIX21522.1 hypothetical protein Syn7803C8_198 [Synechococcus phage ACG-2014f_Syn7803C8]AIX29041.1 hypothetical protein Syn7803US26_188 [Synechococcus phage ACG-2014f_Syn7803US26]AIX29591.1 hypothetical protein Syn7803US30_195 [Synechococcus phage ACG-